MPLGQPTWSWAALRSSAQCESMSAQSSDVTCGISLDMGQRSSEEEKMSLKRCELK